MTPKERLLDAAERLVAERGAEVSAREIAAAAGQRNNSAVQYHFGSRAALHEAVIRRRQEVFERRRRTLLAELDAAAPADGEELVRGLVAVLVRPMTELLEAGPSHYARFLEQVRAHPVLATGAGLTEEWPATREVMRRLARAWPAGDRAVLRRREQALATTLFALLADAERAGAAPDAEELVAMLVGLLTAPAPVPAG